MDAIVAATHNTADALGMLARIGTLQPGKKADLVVVDGNPLGDITLLTSQANVLIVIKDGRTEATAESHKRYLHPGELL